MSPPILPKAQRVAELLPEHLPEGKLGVAVFGPGRGEAIVVRLPDGSLGVVDGCLEPRNEHGHGDPVRELLNRFVATEPGLRLRFVCLTHPHADHYAGLGRLLCAFDGRVDEVWTPFQTGDRYVKAYQAYAELMRHPELGEDEDTLRGLDRAFAELRRRHTTSQPRPRTLVDRHELLHSKMRGVHASIHALGPSTEDTNDAQDALFRALDALHTGERSGSEFDPNQASGALSIRWGSAGVVLAGDLIRGADSLRGWCAIHENAYLTEGPVQVVNVAHHASLGAHHDDLWTAMAPRLAIVTPFQNASGRQPPRPADIERLLASGSEVAITAPPRWEPAREVGPLPVIDASKEVPPDARTTGTTRRRQRSVPESPLRTTPVPGHADRHNAVAVVLDRRGAIRQITLAGKAAFYKRPNA